MGTGRVSGDRLFLDRVLQSRLDTVGISLPGLIILDLALDSGSATDLGPPDG